MRATLGIILAAGVLTIGATAIAVNAARSRQELQLRIAAATSAQARLRAELTRTTTSTQKPDTDRAGAADAKGGSQAGASEPSFPPRSRPPGLLEFAREHPQLWHAFVESKRAELGRLYLPVLQRLGLTPEQQRRFREILAADIARGSDIGAAADAQGLSHADPAIAALREQSDQQRTRELTELLGAAGFAAYERFQRAIPVRGFVDGLAEQLAWSAPLTGRQADELEQALADASEAYRSGQAADPKSVEWERVNRAAERILSPGQFAVWQQGTAHNRFGGSRRDQELDSVYRRAVQRMQDAATAAMRD